MSKTARRGSKKVTFTFMITEIKNCDRIRRELQTEWPLVVIMDKRTVDDRETGAERGFIYYSKPACESSLVVCCGALMSGLRLLISKCLLRLSDGI